MRSRTMLRLKAGGDVRWVGSVMTFIGPHVRELQLRQRADCNVSQMTQLQTLLQKGNIDSVGFDSYDSADHLLLVKTVQSANHKGGRVQQVHLQGQTDLESAPDVLEILLQSKSITSVTLPSWEYLRKADLELVKERINKSSTGALDVAIVPMNAVEAAAHEGRMAEIMPWVTRNSRLAAGCPTSGLQASQSVPRCAAMSPRPPNMSTRSECFLTASNRVKR